MRFINIIYVIFLYIKAKGRLRNNSLYLFRRSNFHTIVKHVNRFNIINDRRIMNIWMKSKITKILKADLTIECNKNTKK